MSLRLAYVLLFTVCSIGFGIAAPAFPVDEKCGANAKYLTCGSACVPDCARPQPPTMCTMQCIIGCFCNEGYLKNAKGECVRPQECEAPHHEIPMQFPQTEPKCLNNEFFNPCGSACAPTCANPDPSPVCTKNCVVGCFCNEGLLRDASGVCVEHTKCNAPTMQLFAYPPELSQCKENEVFLRCGTACPATCANPHPSPVCTRNCVIGCFCKPGFLKNENGVCVNSETCGVPASEALPMLAQVCTGDNEEYRQCKGCDGTCKNPNPMCPRISVPGCACKEGHLRNDNGKCIETRECPAQVQPESFMMLPPVQKCESNEEFRQCKGCDGTCQNPNPLCPRICKPGCACKQGFLRSDAGKCIETRECTAQVQPELLMAETCEANEEFRQCKGCDGTCRNPDPLCPRICKPGCSCKQGFLRSDAGKCINTRECSIKPASFQMLPPKCKVITEIFLTCGTACPATCANPHPSPVCTRNCVIGCFCKEGLLKNAQGVCVEAANC